MKTIAMVGAFVFSVAFGTCQMEYQPLLIRGSYSTKNSQTHYVIEFWNRSNRPIEGMRLRKAGLNIHNLTFDPEYRIPTIQPGKKYTLGVWVRGKLETLADVDLIGIQGRFYQGTTQYHMFFRNPTNCPNWNGGWHVPN